MTELHWLQTCGITTVCDFRSLDVALGGQGAPLVPTGDEILFGNYDFCLNLGGFANISFRKNNRRIAYDICPVNSLLNPLSRKLGLPFDKDGKAGRSGKIIDELLAVLNSNPYYQAAPSKITGPGMAGTEYPAPYQHGSIFHPRSFAHGIPACSRTNLIQSFR